MLVPLGAEPITAPPTPPVSQRSSSGEDVASPTLDDLPSPLPSPPLPSPKEHGRKPKNPNASPKVKKAVNCPKGFKDKKKRAPRNSQPHLTPGEKSRLQRERKKLQKQQQQQQQQQQPSTED